MNPTLIVVVWLSCLLLVDIAFHAYRARLKQRLLKKVEEFTDSAEKSMNALRSSIEESDAGEEWKKGGES